MKGKDNRESYGLGWWLNKELPQKGEKRAYEDAPEDFLMAAGHHGQWIVVLPGYDLVVVRTGLDKKEPLDKNEFFKQLIRSLK